jgi:hypothetical protein
MTAAPQFLGPDGVLRQDYQFTTTLATRFFTGTMDPDTVDMQVSLRGASFTSNPDWITFEGSTFIIPNPSVYPEGLTLFQGENKVQVKSVLSNGTTSGLASVTASLSTDKDLATSYSPPSGIYIEQQDNTVQVFVEGLSAGGAQGYHFYASTAPGGGLEGYYRINPTMVISGETTEDVRPLGTLSVDADIASLPGGSPAADPLYVRVRGTQTDRLGTLLQADFDESVEVPESASRVRMETTVQTVRDVVQFSFVHDRQATLSSINPAIPHSSLSAVPLEDPLYYVVTAVYYTDGVEIESPFSPEVAGAPLVVTPSVGAFPTVSRQQITDTVIGSIYRTHPQVRVEPGSVLRDTFIDPFSTEAQRIRFILQFLHDAQSFTTLLRIDDPGFTGVSVPVSQSAYKQGIKQAFYLSSDVDVQALIDNTFDKLASNVGVVRRGGTRARGEVTLSVSGQPSSSIPFPIGTGVLAGGTRFRTTSSTVISTTGQGRNYNPLTGKFFARAYVQADDIGSQGVVAAGQITALENNTVRVQVTNESPTFGGRDRESNRDLAIRSQGRLASVDSGTLQGYQHHAADQAGVLQAQVIEAGNPLMMRDRNPETGKHFGGKVDVWVRSTDDINEARATDTFAFGFETAEDIRFIPVGLLSDLRFRALDNRLSSSNPILELLDYPNAGLEFVNASQGYSFNITGATYPAYNEVQLSSVYNDPTQHTLTDIVFGAYRYRTSDRYVLTRQPPVAIISLVGASSGVVSPSVYGLYRASSPLVLGRSVRAADYLMVTSPLGAIPGGLLSPAVVAGESHVVLEGVEYLNNLGTNPYTVRVFNNDRTLEYYGPFNITGGVQDWRIVSGSETSPMGIALTETSRITQGQVVLVDYMHDENFVVEYTYTSVIGVTQNAVDANSHITADVLVKAAVRVPVDITATIVLRPRQTKNQVDSLVKSNLAQLFGVLALGDPLYESDVIRAIDQTDGVSHVVTPLVKLTRGDDAMVVREPILVNRVGGASKLDAWSSPSVHSYILADALDSVTDDAGGPSTAFRGVFQDEERLVHVETRPNSFGFPLRSSVGQAFIIGSEGIEILGYSDNATLQVQFPFATPEDLQQKRIQITANRVVVTVAPENHPSDYSYTVTYTVQGDTGTKSIDPGPVEYLVLGDLEFTYDQETGTR